MSSLLRFKRLALALTAMFTAVACSPADRAEIDSAAGKAGDVIGAAADTIAGRISGREYTNAELVGFINAYNDAEIEIGEMAQTKATDPQVRDFARRIVSEHRALKTEVTNTAQRLNVTPTMPTADESLRQDHTTGMRDLTARAKGRAFDEALLEHEIKMHKKVLDEIEDALSRNRNQEIRPLLENARSGIQAHLKTAEELEKRVGT